MPMIEFSAVIDSEAGRVWSCGARRMAESAVLLMDEVFPE
jgi:hypothetical protein